MIEPTLRFPNFQKEYITKQLSEITTRVKRKNTDNQTDRPLTISSIEGLVDQRSYFDKPIASKDMSNYFFLKKGEFAYNKSYSKGYPVGSIKRLDGYDNGALSTLYICFSLNKDSNILSDYLKQYFDSNVWHKKVKEICAEGARNHGLLNVIPDDFYAVEHNFAPTIEEQKKVAEFLNLYDQKILIQSEKIKALESIKNSILTKLFKNEIQLKDENGIDFDPWEYTLLSDVLVERKQKSTGNEEVYSVSVSKGLVNQVEHLGRSYAAEDTSKYKVACPGDVIYTKSPTGDFKWGIVKQSTIEKNVIISPLYGVFIPKNKYLGQVIDAYFSSSVRAHNYLITQIRKGAKNTINVTNDEFLDKGILLPIDERECKKISEIVLNLNRKIEIERDKLDSMRTIKLGLSQRLFC